MIFVTVGTQLPFDRLIEAIDTIAPRVAQPIFAQTGKSAYQPTNVEFEPFIRPLDVDAYYAKADIIVAHAGIGTILTCQKLGKPVIIYPRLARFGEHRNDHQLATAAQLEGRTGIYVARTPEDLEALLGQALTSPAAAGAPNPSRDRLRQHIDGIIRQATSA